MTAKILVIDRPTPSVFNKARVKGHIDFLRGRDFEPPWCPHERPQLHAAYAEGYYKSKANMVRSLELKGGVGSHIKENK